MPKVLRSFLENIHIDYLDEVWEYLDGNPDAIHEMIEILAKRIDGCQKEEFSNTK